MSDDGPKAGSICHVEFGATDLARAKEFYGELFGWTFTDMNPTYALFRAGDLSGGIDTERKPGGEGAVIVIAVEDIDRMLVDIRAAGGLTIQEKTEIPDGYGHYAYFSDPFGNRIGLWTPVSRT